jgi:hypothetical protein
MALLGRFRHLCYFRFGWERTLVDRMPDECKIGIEVTPKYPAWCYDRGLAQRGAIVPGHKFKIGRLVVFRLGWRSQVDAARGVYQIKRRLPAAEDGEFQYEIRNTLEEHDRVAKESELTPA